MSTLIYNQGLDLMQDWTTGTYKFLLLKSSAAAFDRDMDFVADVVASSAEISASGYARDTVTTPTRTVSDVDNCTYYDCDDPDFGSIAAGQTVGRMVLFKFITNDASSLLIADFDLTDTPTDGNPFTVVLNPSGVMKHAAAAGS